MISRPAKNFSTDAFPRRSSWAAAAAAALNRTAARAAFPFLFPRFENYEELKRSGGWAEYLQHVYGNTITASDFPLDLGSISIFFRKYLGEEISRHPAVRFLDKEQPTEAFPCPHTLVGIRQLKKASPEMLHSSFVFNRTAWQKWHVHLNQHGDLEVPPHRSLILSSDLIIAYQYPVCGTKHFLPDELDKYSAAARVAHHERFLYPHGAPSHTKVEVVHRQWGLDGAGKYWMYLAPGSGIWFDLGHTYVLSRHIDTDNTARIELRAHLSQNNVSFSHNATSRELLGQAIAAGLFDSIQQPAADEFGVHKYEIQALFPPTSTENATSALTCPPKAISHSFSSGWRGRAPCHCKPSSSCMLNCGDRTPFWSQNHSSPYLSHVYYG